MGEAGHALNEAAEQVFAGRDRLQSQRSSPRLRQPTLALELVLPEDACALPGALGHAFEPQAARHGPVMLCRRVADRRSQKTNSQPSAIAPDEPRSKRASTLGFATCRDPQAAAACPGLLATTSQGAGSE